MDSVCKNSSFKIYLHLLVSWNSVYRLVLSVRGGRGNSFSHISLNNSIKSAIKWHENNQLIPNVIRLIYEGGIDLWNAVQGHRANHRVIWRMTNMQTLHDFIQSGPGESRLNYPFHYNGTQDKNSV